MLNLIHYLMALVPTAKTFVALHDYEPTSDRDLGFKKGDRLIVISE